MIVPAIAAVFILNLLSRAFAQSDSEIKELVSKSSFIALAYYDGYDQDSVKSYPPHAKFKLVQILIGKGCCKTKLPIRFVRSENISEAAPSQWQFTEKEMPEIGSRWVIFLEQLQPHDGGFDTYKGSLGRVAYTHETLMKIRQEIQLKLDSQKRKESLKAEDYEIQVSKLPVSIFCPYIKQSLALLPPYPLEKNTEH